MRVKVSRSLKTEIEDDLTTGRLVPGDRLDEQMLADRFGVSRTPAREALLQLEAAGLVEFVPRRGAVVLGVSAELAVAIMESQTALESELAGLAARRMTREEKAAITSVHQQCCEYIGNEDIAGYIKGNETFHELIYSGARNAYMADLVRTIGRRVRLIRRRALERPSRLPLSWQEHDAILAAIKHGDEPSAREAMRLHMLSGGTVFADIVTSLASAAAAAKKDPIHRVGKR
jgi:DNA-binding GntR family transcriptional regulator